MNEAVMEGNKVELRSSVTITTRKLQASYEIENRSGEDIYVLDAMFQLLRGQPRLDESLAYTVIDRDLLTLFRGVLRIPEGLQVEVPDLPFARLLPSGKTLKSIIDAPIPLRFNQPYEWNEREEMRTTQSIRLRIGYVVVKDLDPRPEAKVVNGVEVYRVGYRQVIDVQRFLETPAKDATVSILVKP